MSGSAEQAPRAPTGRLAGAAIRGAPPLWVAVNVGIVAWIAHLSFLASMGAAVCRDASLVWVVHAATAVTGGATVAGIVACRRLLVTFTDDEGQPTVSGRTRFMALLGVAVGAFNLALILLEGIYFPLIRTCS